MLKPGGVHGLFNIKIFSLGEINWNRWSSIRDNGSGSKEDV